MFFDSEQLEGSTMAGRHRKTWSELLTNLLDLELCTIAYPF